MKDQKYIKVLSRGYVTTNRGRAFTPITRAFKESTQNIFTMITKEKATVVEVLSNGKEIQLTPQNFDKDNEVLEVKKTIAVTVAAPVAEVAPVETATTSDEWVPTGETTDEEWVRSDDDTADDEEAVEETEETSDEQSTDTQQGQQYYGKRNKKNRHRNGNGAPQVTPETV